ncbi:MAG: class I lanthipeptide [Bacteroidota bacterium]
MKKKSIKKLSLRKAPISNLSSDELKGGTDQWQSVYLCESDNWCQTIDYTACDGGWNCGIFERTRNCF